MEKQTLEERLEIYVTEKGKKGHSSDKLLLAASAVAGVGAMIIPPPAEAAIVYSGLKNAEVKVGQEFYSVDLNGDKNVEFVFQLSYPIPYMYSQKLAVKASDAAVIESNHKPANLPGNYSISGGNTFAPVSSDDLAVYASSAAVDGNFLGKQGFLGVTFTIDSNTHYGWIQYRAKTDATVGTIIDWAYEDIPGEAIKTPHDFNWNLFLPAIIGGSKNK